MVRRNFVSIADMGGLTKYLDDNRSDFNGLGYADLYERLRLHVPFKRIAFDFGISYNTLRYSWIPRLPAKDKATLEWLSVYFDKTKS